MEQKLDAGTVFERVFAVYRDQFTLLVPAALVVFVPVAIVNGVLRESGGLVLAVLAIIIGAIATVWFQGMVVEAAHDILDGRRDHTVGSLLSAVTPVIGPLLVAGFLSVIATGLGFLLIVPGLFLLTIWALIAPVIVIERTDAMSSFGRSRALVKDHGWQVLAVLIVLLLLKLVLSAVVVAILLAIADSVVSYVAADLITNVLIAPLSALAAAVLYFELRRLHGETPLPAAAAYTPPEPSSAPTGPPTPGPEAPFPAPAPQAPPPTAPERP